MAKQQLDFTFDRFTGMSEDDALTQEWQVLFSEWLDLQSNSNFFNLAQKPKAYLTLDSEPVGWYIVDVWTHYFPVFCTDNKDIYKWTIGITSIKTFHR